MTVPVTAASTDAGMHFRTPRTSPSVAQLRRVHARALRPLLGSSRLTTLFLKIGLLAITRPAAVGILELAVDKLAQHHQVQAHLNEPADTGASLSTAGGQQR
jgi:hypothetical protein